MSQQKPGRKPLHVNYRFLLDHAEKLRPERGDLLDFGCGKGDLVQAALDRGWRACGIEYFGAGAGCDIEDVLQNRGLLGTEVLRYDGSTIPFGAESFDVVVSNMVFEHVPDLQATLREIARVLRSGGMLICCFPSGSGVREGHCNVPFAHWLPRSRARVLWLYMFRCLGLGRLKQKGSKWRWSAFFNDWLEENTFYLSSAEIDALVTDTFDSHRYDEDLYLSYRMTDRGWERLAGLSTSRPARGLSRWFGRNFASLVIVARKAPAGQPQ
jgi:SAM-dependent methyltransferase